MNHKMVRVVVVKMNKPTEEAKEQAAEKRLENKLYTQHLRDLRGW